MIACEHGRSLAGLVARAFDGLSATHFVAAVALGLANSLFGALTDVSIPVPRGTLLVAVVALLATMVATLAVDRAGYRKSGWALLAATYVVLLAGIDQLSTARGLMIGQIMAHCLVLAVAVADQATASGSSGRRAYINAGLVGIAAGALTWAAVANFGPDFFTDDAFRVEAESPWFMLVHPVYVALHWLLFGGAAVLLYGERRLALATVERLRVAELQRIARSREVIQSKLQAMQARVEPRFLFNTLAHVRRLYGGDAEMAERMLTELVAFLRAAMPWMRDTSSTVAQEAALVRAYLCIVRIRLCDLLDFSIEIPADVAGARLPPMLLLPLVDCAFVHGLRPAHDGGKLSIAASVVDKRLRLAIVDTGAGFVADSDGSEITSIRERLAALYGERASLRVGFVPSGGMEALLEMPYEPSG